MIIEEHCLFAASDKQHANIQAADAIMQNNGTPVATYVSSERSKQDIGRLGLVCSRWICHRALRLTGKTDGQL